MKLEILAVAIACLVSSRWRPKSKRPERKSLLDSDPNVVYLDQTIEETDRSQSDQGGSGFFRQGGQASASARSRRTRPSGWRPSRTKSTASAAKARRDGISGWVAPWAFSSTDPEFVANFKQLYDRQIQVQKLIAAKQVAVGMTLDEVSLSRGKPTKTCLRKTAKGQSGQLGVHRLRGRQELHHRDRPAAATPSASSPASPAWRREKPSSSSRTTSSARSRKARIAERKRADHRAAVDFRLVGTFRSSAREG